MSSKRAKLTAGKARERVASLEESISARQHRLDQLVARLERSDSPDERLLTAKVRLERRLAVEKEQLEKLLKLLERSTSQPEESGEFFASEEIEDIHRSFEDMRQNLAQMQSRIDSSELPRDLTTRLSSFEERVSRREEVDSELFSQVLSLQTALDQERQTVRRLSRRIREQDQSLDALREAVEDSVVATVDLAERLDELEESLSDPPESKTVAETPEGEGRPSQGWSSEMEILRELAEDARRGLVHLQRQLVESLEAAAHEREELRLSQAALSQQQQQQQHRQSSSAQAVEAVEPVEAVEVTLTEPSSPRQPASADAELLEALMLRLTALEEASRARALPVPLDDSSAGTGRPAVFATNGSPSRKVAVFATRPPLSD